MKRWKENDIPDLQGKIALVTGANSGLGLETSRALAARGAQVVLACRGAEKAQKAIDDIRGRVPGTRLEFLSMDLSDLGSVRNAVERFRADHQKLDILVNNAGVMALPYGKTRDGFETLFGTNHLGHFALTGLLLDTIMKTPKARIVTVSSIAHRTGRMNIDDPNWEKRRYSKSGAYGQSKLANLLFALELERRLRRAGADTISVAVHPGYTATNIAFSGNDTRNTIFGRMVMLGNAIMAQPPELGALPTLYGAVAPEVEGGSYVGPHALFGFRGYPVRETPTRRARDEVMATRLWDLSEKLTGVRFLSPPALAAS